MSNRGPYTLANKSPATDRHNAPGRRMQRLIKWFAVAVSLFAATVSAQDFPSRPVTLIVPWPAGGSTDLVMRALATSTEKYLGQPIVIENKPGEAGTLGARALV